VSYIVFRVFPPLPAMSALRNIRLLLWRNCIKRRRAMCSFCCELFFPVLVVLLFVGLFRAFTPDKFTDRMYPDKVTQVPNLAGMAFRMKNMSSVLALGAFGAMFVQNPL
jgi:hypothetical protein